ncbi:MAG: hypothetical protein A2Y76_02375 [Planctomycetes bacterium RBG_13_60_9]|nr:MAG: hypothetical protein A2Y76_02375 [Planctomycetes bacterium RBG_13_60_9]
MSATDSRLSRRKRQIWLYIIAALFICDFVVCGYMPSQQRLSSLRDSRVQQQRTIQMAAAQGAELPGLHRRLRNMEKAVERFELRVPADEALGTFLQQIAGIMTGCHLTDQVVLQGKAVAVDNLNCIPIHVTCKGTLTDIFNFFTRLQTLDRLVRIEKVSLENDAGLTGQVSLQIEAVVFQQSWKQRKANGPAEARQAGGANHGA